MTSIKATLKSLVPDTKTVLVLSLAGLITLSLLMIASASISFTMTHNLSTTHFFVLQAGYVTLGIIAALILERAPPKLIKLMFKTPIIIAMAGITIALVIATLFYEKTNGASRWLQFFGFQFQPVELLKVVMVIVTSHYAVKYSYETRHLFFSNSVRLILLMIPLTLVAIQPDYGSFLLMTLVVLAIVFVSGAQVLQFVAVLSVVLVAGVLGAFAQPYRVARVLGFLDPFDDTSDTDYQSVRSLVAYAHGGLTGNGYGQSVQKIKHLPEAHTDFLLSITAEELGFLGAMSVLLLQTLVIGAVMRVSYLNLKRRQLRLAYMCFGFGLIFIIQTFVNAGASMNILPTKGLTFPFFSYGGSAVVMNLVMIGLVLAAYRASKDDSLDMNDY